MDSSQVPLIGQTLNPMEFNLEVGTNVLKKSLEVQTELASSVIEMIPKLPANPAIGRNINITA